MPRPYAPHLYKVAVPRPYVPHLDIVDREGGLQGEPVAVELQHGVPLASQRVQTGDSGAAERQRCREAEKQKLKPGVRGSAEDRSVVMTVGRRRWCYRVGSGSSVSLSAYDKHNAKSIDQSKVTQLLLRRSEPPVRNFDWGDQSYILR